MNFEKKTWVNRISEYPLRRELTYLSDNSSELVTVARSEGTISEPGDAFSADNMNNLESRIEQAIQEGSSDIQTFSSIVNSSLSSMNSSIDTLNTSVASLTTKLGGYTLKYMTKAQYNALTTKDSNTLYFIPE